jgi:hypothetical protein
MARNRVIYQSQALYAAATGEMTGHQIMRVQDVSHTVDIARQDVNEFGKLAAITREVIEPPTVGTDFTYYLGSGQNEAFLGLYVQGIEPAKLAPGNIGNTTYAASYVTGGTDEKSAICALIGGDGQQNQKNLYVRTVEEGDDVVGIASGKAETVLGIGNAFITDYTINAAVGDLPTVSVSVEGNNMNVTETTAASGGAVTGVQNAGLNQNGTKINIDGGVTWGFTGAAGMGITTGVMNSTQTLLSGSDGWYDWSAGNFVSQGFSALRPGDMSLSLGSGIGIVSLDDLHVQSASVSVPLSRTSLSKIGSRYAYFKAPDFPATATMTINGIVASGTGSNVADIICNSSGEDIYLDFTTPDCTDSKTAFRVKLKDATVDNLSLSSSIGDNQTVDVTWSTQMGAAGDTDAGVFLRSNF